METLVITDGTLVQRKVIVVTLLDNRWNRGLSELPAIADTFSAFNLDININQATMMKNFTNFTLIAQQNCRMLTTSSLHTSSVPVLDSWYVTGFFDGESTFVVSVQQNSKMKTGWECRAWFILGLNRKDKNLAQRLQSFFGVGKVFEKKTGCRV